MLAKAASSLPKGEGWLYEPKWDGFRAIVFRDGDELFLQSRDLKPLDRYFPELAEPLRIRRISSNDTTGSLRASGTIRGSAVKTPATSV